MATNTRIFHIDKSPYRDVVQESSFFRPRISIEYNTKQTSIYSVDRTYSISGNSRRYLRVNVKNAVFASKLASNCNASLIVIPLNSEKQHPAIEYVRLMWEGEADEVNVNIQTRVHIQPGEKRLLHMIFSDSTFPSILVNPPSPIHASISSKEALDTFHPRIIEHGFPVGDFIVEVTITSDNSRPCKCYFMVNVGSE
jgi:hypothetical protein